MHDTLQLREACLKDPYIKNTFVGVFAADQVPYPKLARLKNWSIIINTDPASQPGQHWVASMKRNGTCYFFDSYGNAPSYYQKQLWKPLMRCVRNTKDYQQTYSTVCGDYCLFFLRLFHLNDFKPSFSHVDEYLDENKDEENDNFIHETVHEWFPAILNQELHDQQLATSVSGRQNGGFLGRKRVFNNQICVARRCIE